MDFYKDIEKKLINFQKPARYIGNETGIPEKGFKNLRSLLFQANQ